MVWATRANRGSVSPGLLAPSPAPLAPLAGQPGFSGCLLRQNEGEEGPSLPMFVPSLEPSPQRPGSRAGGSGDGG